MNCGDVFEKDLVERYVAGTLSEDDRSEFEIHFLDCERCAQDVDTALAIRDALQTTAPKRRTIPIWAGAAAATALLAVGLGAWWNLRDVSTPTPPIVRTPAAVVRPPAQSPSGPDPRILELARIDPPQYEETVLRGSGTEAFRAAMRDYVNGRYPEAIAGLEKAVASDPRASHVRFFLGASYLLDGRAEPAIETLRVVARDRDSAFAEEAKFYLAKALLRAGRLEEAKAELKALIADGGAWASDARELLARLG